MGLLDRFEQTLERLLEGTTGALFRQKLQPAEIGKKLERAMLDNQQASMGTRIVPNAYTVRLNPKDHAQVAGYAAGLSRQMESWLAQVANRQRLTALDKIVVTFVEDDTVPQRNPRIDALIVDHVDDSRPQRRTQRRPHRDGTQMIRPPRQDSAAPRLISASGETFDIPEGESTIGRSPDNTIVLDSPDVSRRHARIERSGSHVRIFDADSTNGTRINGEAIFVSDIQDGDELQIGSQVLELRNAARADGGWARR